jgi:hypothetical protein
MEIKEKFSTFFCQISIKMNINKNIPRSRAELRTRWVSNNQPTTTPTTTCTTNVCYQTHPAPNNIIITDQSNQHLCYHHPQRCVDFKLLKDWCQTCRNIHLKPIPNVLPYPHYVVSNPILHPNYATTPTYLQSHSNCYLPPQ